MYERIFENDIISNVSSEYFSITGNVIHIKITALYPARLVRLS